MSTTVIHGFDLDGVCTDEITEPLDFGAAEERGGSSVAERGGWAEWRGKGRRLCLEGRAARPRQPAAASAFGRGRGRRCVTRKGGVRPEGPGVGVLAGPWASPRGCSRRTTGLWKEAGGERSGGRGLPGGRADERPGKRREGSRVPVGEGLVIFWVPRAELASEAAAPHLLRGFPLRRCGSQPARPFASLLVVQPWPPQPDRKSTRLNSSHRIASRMPSSA